MSLQDDLREMAVATEAQERANGKGQHNQSADGQVRTITASTIKPKRVRWLWRGWVPMRMVTLFVGLPGLGKTTFAEQLAADVTRGELAGALKDEPADVLILSYEDALAETLVPRLIAAGADLDRVHFLACEKVGSTLDLTRHLPEIDRLAAKHNARMLFIDPLVAGLPAGEVNSHRDQDVRSVLAPIAMLAERRDLAVLATMHFSKSAASALLGAGGSIGFVGAARSVLVFGADPSSERGNAGPDRVLAHAKCNVGRHQKSRQVWIQPILDGEDAIETSRAVLGDECDVTADQLVGDGGGAKESPRVQAERFLRELLADGPHASSEVESLSEDAGIAQSTLKRAKRDMNIDCYQDGRRWWWRLPAGFAGEPEDTE